jgi:hypothetical protein
MLEKNYTEEHYIRKKVRPSEPQLPPLFFFFFFFPPPPPSLSLQNFIYNLLNTTTYLIY